MGQLASLLNRIDSPRKERGEEFERLCKWFLENDPIYATQLEKVWLWDEWPDRWGPDAGIDLVARTRQGELWAIQAKHYAPESTVSKADIDSFLSESSRPGFAFRLLIATTDRLSANAKRTLAGQKVPAQALLRSQLVERELVWPDRVGQKPKRRKPHTPRPHQKDAIKDVTKGFMEADRGQLIMACGTGKTLTSLFIAETLAAKRVLVLVPSLSLLSQTLSEWTANAKKPIEFLPVCSDATVAEKDAAVESTSELGFPVTTNPSEIAAFVRRRGDTMRVVFATYQSSERIEAAQKLSRVPKFDLVIADEAHRCTGNTTSDFATVLDAGKVRADRRLFMTATPRILSARAKRSAVDADVEFASMDDEDTFGPVFHRLTFATAIEQKLLADYQVVILGVDNEEVLKAVQERQLVTTNGKDIISADRLGSAVGLAKAIRKYGLTRLITFHGRVKAASNFADAFPAILDWMPARQRPKGTTETNFVSGEMSAGERKRALHHLKTSEADQVILANARVLTEGIDVPDLDGVAFMDPRNSEVDIVQAVGRAIRKPRGKNKDKIGTIVLPIVIEQTEDAEEELDRSDYKAIWAVLRALRAHDERLAVEIDQLRRGLVSRRRVGRIDLPQSLVFDLPKGVSGAFSTSFATRLVEATSSAWEEGFAQLELFLAEYGHASPAYSYCADNGFALGSWTTNQRRRRASLPKHRVMRLEALPGWSWDPRHDLFDYSFERLVQYKSQTGSAAPARSFCFEDGFRLGDWVHNIRGRRESLSPERVQRLEQLPGWLWETPDDAWARGFSQLEEFIRQHGHANPPQRYRSPDGYALGYWVNVNRRNRDTLDDARRTKLEDLDEWIWNTRDHRWSLCVTALEAFVNRHGHSLIPVEHVTNDGLKLGAWAANQRANRARLSDDRRNDLENVDGWQWNINDARWHEGFARLRQYAKLRGNSRPVRGHVEDDGYALGSWVNSQRARREKLAPERRRLLESLPGWTWNAHEASWEEGLEALVNYCHEHGHASPDQDAKTSSGFRVGQWVSRQRQARATLDVERRIRLEELQGWVWEARRCD